MPAKKKTETETVAEVKKTTKKAAAKVKDTEEKAAKTTKKAAAAKKTTAKKETAEKKPAAKKTAAKKVAAEVVKEEAPKLMSAEDYAAKIKTKKQEAHDKNWLYIELRAGDLNAEFEAAENLEAVCTAMGGTMLEGDCFVIDTFGTSADLTVRYYVDNLSAERKKYNA